MVEEENKTEVLLNDKTEILSADNSQEANSAMTEKLEDFFSIRSKVGDGGMGVVYLAKDIRLNRYVAIKRLKPQFLVDAQIRKRFIHEAKAVASLNHANIVHIYFIGEDSNGPYFVMEYVEGAVANPEHPNLPNPPHTLEQYIVTNGVMSIDEAIDFIGKIGGGVAVAHSLGVIHRDLKPTNILVDSSNLPKIVDFGLARITNPDVLASALTVTGDKFISLGYAAPEQEQDASTTDERADIYGLGGIAYYILTGKNPRFFREDDLPENIRGVISKALATDREQRWQTAEEFVAAINQCKLDNQPERPTVKTTWRCKWCDTINPLSTRYCGSCGWDGGTVCAECGSPNHFGVMFCSVCGANCKEYERAQFALDEIKAALASAQFERVIVNGSKPLNFEPVGPNGRKLLEEINHIYIKAKKNQEHRDELSEIISMEINTENYERAERFINEFRELVNSPEAYETELSEFPQLKQRRDLARISKAFSSNDWRLGESILESISVPIGPSNKLELKRIHVIHEKHLRRKRFFRYQLVFVAFFAYLLLLPFVAAFLPKGIVSKIWYPANVIVKGIGLNGVVDSIALSLGQDNIEDIFSKENQSPAVVVNQNNSNEKTTRILDEFNNKQLEYKKQYDDKLKAWQDEYISALKDLLNVFLSETNMNAWMEVQNELDRFKNHPNDSIPLIESSEEYTHRIVSLQNKYIFKRDMILASVFWEYIAVTNEKIDEFDSKIKSLMHQSSEQKESENEAYATELMNEAVEYKRIIEIIKKKDFYLEATAFLRSFEEKYPEIYLADFNEPVVKEIRAHFEQGLSNFVSQRADKNHALCEDYKKALEDLLKKNKDAGDYDGRQAITEEQKRFEHTKKIILNTTNPELEDLTGKFIAREQEESKKIDQDLIAYVDAYIEKLNKLVSEYTRDDNMNLAGALKGECTRVQMDADLVGVRNRIKQ